MFTLQEYLDDIRDELMEYHYDECRSFIVSDGDNVLEFSSAIEEIGPEKWDVIVTIVENGECIYSNLYPEDTLDMLCDKYYDTMFFEVEGD